jgi:hypothetical protein
MAKFILFGLTPQLFGEIRAHAKEQKISVTSVMDPRSTIRCAVPDCVNGIQTQGHLV